MMKNKLSTHKTPGEKLSQYHTDIANNTVAYRSNMTTVPLSKCPPETVEFIGGLWRVQDIFPHKIQEVRDDLFVLIERLPRQERNLFEFYRAQRVSQNCYGYHMVSGLSQIVAKYTTDKGTYWAYGSTVEQARAFLGIKLYDEYSDIIHSVACKNQPKEK